MTHDIRLHAAFHRARFAISFVRDEKQDARETDENVDDPFDRRPRTQDEIDDIPVASGESAETHQAPVEGADDDENERDHVKCFHIDLRYIDPIR